MLTLTYSSSFLDIDKVETLHTKFISEASVDVKTSGSTGKPKILTFDMETLKNSAKMTNTHFQFTDSTKALLCLSPETIAGKMMCIRAFVGKFSLHVQNPSSRPLQHIDFPIDFVAMVPLQLNESLLHDLEKLKSIRVILIGGGPISEESAKTLKQNNLTVHHSYGMTETATHIALRKVGAETEEHFKALPGVTFSMENDQLMLSAEHLGIRNLMTNDIVELVSSNSFKWIGRKDFVVNSGGYKIQMEELESRIEPHVKLPFFLWKEPSDKWGEMLVIGVEMDGFKNLPRGFEYLPKKWERPKIIYLFDKFIYSESGKVLRNETFALRDACLIMEDNE